MLEQLDGVQFRWIEEKQGGFEPPQRCTRKKFSASRGLNDRWTVPQINGLRLTFANDVDEVDVQRLLRPYGLLQKVNRLNRP